MQSTLGPNLTVVIKLDCSSFASQLGLSPPVLFLHHVRVVPHQDHVAQAGQHHNHGKVVNHNA